jgi:PAS domain S-box-containing protein
VFEQTEDAIIFFKPGGCSLIDVNATTERLFGFSRKELLCGGTGLIFATDDLPRVEAALRQAGAGNPSQLDTLGGRRRDGTEFILSMRAKTMTLRGVEIVFSTFRDITDRVSMEQKTRDIQAMLIQANKMTSLGLLVSGVAHEINNPNNFILANSQLLARTWNDARRILREYHRENGEFLLGGVPFSELDAHTPQLFGGIVDGSRRINDIINNLKGFARQDRSVAADPVDVNQAATSAVSILHHELLRHTENFHLELAVDLPMVRGSSQQLGQVVINLLMNACQALPSRAAAIWLTTAFDPGAGLVVVSIRDEGCGMTREESRRIMEPFFTTRLDRGGTGLGLSICHSIVREHQGLLEFVSAPGKGTTFFMKLPAAETSQGRSAA